MARPGTSRRGFLRTALAAAALTALPTRRARAADSRYLLVYWNAGGWDPAFVFDPHFDSATIHHDPAAVAATIGGIPVADAASRPSVRAFLEAHGARTLLFNGISVGSISHDACSSLMLTGRRGTTGADLPSLLASRTAGSLALPHVVLSGPRYPGDLGGYSVVLGRTLTGTATGALPEDRPYAAETEARLTEWLTTEADTRGGGTANTAYHDGLTRLAALHARAASLDLPEDPTQDDLVRVGLGLLSAGLTRSLILEGDLPMLTHWDSHQRNDTQQDAAFEHLFSQLGALMDALAATPDGDGTPLADRTTVLVLSEMGRTPVLNSGEGKDHWPYTSALLLGAGVAGGRVIGATDDTFTGMPVDVASGELSDTGDVLTPAHLAATVLAGFDVDPGDLFPEAAPVGGVWG
jgi:hypothetical protein